MSFLATFQALLTDGQAWCIEAYRDLKKFFIATATLPQDIREEYHYVWLDNFPQTTRYLDEMEQDFGIYDGGAGKTEQERRDRLTGLWLAIGGQSPKYIQDTLQASGFDVYVHEWWVPGSEPPVARNPNEYLGSTYQDAKFMMVADVDIAHADQPEAVSDYFEESSGYLLVNKILESIPTFEMVADSEIAYADQPEAVADYFTAFNDEYKLYNIPQDPDLWPYFVYVGGETFPDVAQVPLSRRDEFENLVLKLMPEHLWVGLLIEYV